MDLWNVSAEGIIKVGDSLLELFPVMLEDIVELILDGGISFVLGVVLDLLHGDDIFKRLGVVLLDVGEE